MDTAKDWAAFRATWAKRHSGTPIPEGLQVAFDVLEASGSPAPTIRYAVQRIKDSWNKAVSYGFVPPSRGGKRYQRYYSANSAKSAAHWSAVRVIAMIEMQVILNPELDKQDRDQ